MLNTLLQKTMPIHCNFKIGLFGAGTHFLLICFDSFFLVTVSEGGHVRTNCLFDLCVWCLPQQPTAKTPQGRKSIAGSAAAAPVLRHMSTNMPFMLYMLWSVNITITLVGSEVRTFCQSAAPVTCDYEFISVAFSLGGLFCSFLLLLISFESIKVVSFALHFW